MQKQFSNTLWHGTIRVFEELTIRKEKHEIFTFRRFTLRKGTEQF